MSGQNVRVLSMAALAAGRRAFPPLPPAYAPVPAPVSGEPATPRPDPAGRLFADSLHRALRGRQARRLLVLHLSRLAAPAPRAHHVRVANAILRDVALRFDGQDFVLPNGDLALMWRPGVPATSAPNALVSDPESLPATFSKLFRLDAPDPADLLSVWALPEQGRAALDYALAALATRVLAQPADIAPAPPPAEAEALPGPEDMAGLLRREVAARFSGTRLRAEFRQLAVSLAAIEARAGRAGGQPGADPDLLRHVARRLDQPMLKALAHAWLSGGPLDLSRADGVRPHLRLTLPGILSPEFHDLAGRCTRAGVELGIEVSLAEACADADGFIRAHAAIRSAGFLLVLDEVSPLALGLTDLAALGPDLVRLDWSPRLTSLAAQERAALTSIGPDRIVLGRADTEAALGWGLTQGIKLFQGRHVDAMLGAGRILACAHATGCSLGQCIARAAATEEQGRSGCADPARLEDATAHHLATPEPAL
jgi:hypothetical protein